MRCEALLKNLLRPRKAAADGVSFYWLYAAPAAAAIGASLRGEVWVLGHGCVGGASLLLPRRRAAKRILMPNENHACLWRLGFLRRGIVQETSSDDSEIYTRSELASVGGLGTLSEVLDDI